MLYQSLSEGIKGDGRSGSYMLLKWLGLTNRPLSTNKLRICLVFETIHISMAQYRESEYYNGDDKSLEKEIRFLTARLDEVSRGKGQRIGPGWVHMTYKHEGSIESQSGPNLGCKSKPRKVYELQWGPTDFVHQPILWFLLST